MAMTMTVSLKVEVTASWFAAQATATEDDLQRYGVDGCLAMQVRDVLVAAGYENVDVALDD